MKGRLYGVGIGPGDPELLTIKAYKLIKESNCIALPGKVPEETLAYRIVKPLFDDLDEKELMGIAFPMTKDPEILRANHQAGADKIAAKLDQGENVVFLTLGDPSVYATYTYVHKLVGDMGYETEIIPGITSFCAAAAKLNGPLVEGKELLHVIPASYGVEEALDMPGTKVMMKSGKEIRKVVNTVLDKGLHMSVVENCFLPGERILQIPDCENWEQELEQIGYYTLVIVK